MIEKTFCIAGSVRENLHYFLPDRLDWELLLTYIERTYYFVLHAPRQSGKTTAIKQLIRRLNGNSKYAALYINVESGQAARDNFEKALIGIVNELANAIHEQLDEKYAPLAIELRNMGTGPISVTFLLDAIRYMCRIIEKPVILFIDEIDALIGDSLLSVLRQIRTGYDERPESFPQSLCLIGLRDVRDYRVWSQQAGAYVSTSSPFNIKAVSLRLSNFSIDDVKALYEQHTFATGQKFTPEAIKYAHYLTQGQPWLVNALAQEACFVEVLDRTLPITKEVIEKAKETLILRRDTHIDSLVDKLQEKRVVTVIDSIINGAVSKPTFTPDDIQYAIDLGLISPTASSLQIANPIYHEIIPAVIATTFQKSIPIDSSCYVKEDKSLNMKMLIEAFTQFFRENAHAWLEDFPYKESGPHILMLAFMQRVINGGGHIQREYALGNKRVDLFIKWKNQRFVIELKIKHGPDYFQKGLEQTAHYMNICGAEGHLVIFDRDMTKPWEEKISYDILPVGNHQVHVWTM